MSDHFQEIWAMPCCVSTLLLRRLGAQVEQGMQTRSPRSIESGEEIDQGLPLTLNRLAETDPASFRFMQIFLQSPDEVVPDS